MKTKAKFNPRNKGKLGKKRSAEFCKAQSARLLGKTKSAQTRAKMSKAASRRWADPEYRAKHGAIMKRRWAMVHKAEKLLGKEL